MFKMSKITLDKWQKSTGFSKPKTLWNRRFCISVRNLNLPPSSCLSHLFLSESSAHSLHVINEIWSVMRNCHSACCSEQPQSVFNCSVCSLTELNIKYKKKKKIKTCCSGKVTQSMLQLNTGNNDYHSKPSKEPLKLLFCWQQLAKQQFYFYFN